MLHHISITGKNNASFADTFCEVTRVTDVRCTGKKINVIAIDECYLNAHSYLFNIANIFINAADVQILEFFR